MKKIFNSPEITISAFNMENVVTTSGGVVPTDKTASQKAAEGLNAVSIATEDIISLTL